MLVEMLEIEHPARRSRSHCDGKGCAAGSHGFIGYASNTTMLYGSHLFEVDYSQVRRRL